jgi:hypothetical protein
MAKFLVGGTEGNITSSSIANPQPGPLNFSSALDPEFYVEVLGKQRRTPSYWFGKYTHV